MERSLFISRIAERLGHQRTRQVPDYSPIGISSSYRDQPFGSSTAEFPGLTERFAAELEAIGGTVHIANSLDEVSTFLKSKTSAVIGSQIATWAREEFDSWKIAFLWDELNAFEYSSRGDTTIDAELRSRMSLAVIGVTTVSYAVVNTGSLVLYTNSRRNRSVSLLPATHIALVKESQLVSRIGEAFPGVGTNEQAQVPSSIHFITGPSRSADIENDLSIGVHGPAALTVIIHKGI